MVAHWFRLPPGFPWPVVGYLRWMHAGQRWETLCLRRFLASFAARGEHVSETAGWESLAGRTYSGRRIYAFPNSECIFLVPRLGEPHIHRHYSGRDWAGLWMLSLGAVFLSAHLVEVGNWRGAAATMCQLVTLLTWRLYAIITGQLYLLEFMSKIEVDGCDVVQEDQGMLHHRILRTF